MQRLSAPDAGTNICNGGHLSASKACKTAALAAGAALGDQGPFVPVAVHHKRPTSPGKSNSQSAMFLKSAIDA